ncbi:MAG: choice-of-anchor tandem repeat GloVer-containing protein [Terriglobales bacterium]|jgi:uncharacterized repeat protein (TIGR03803 family)
MKRFLRAVLTLSGLCLLIACGGGMVEQGAPPPTFQTLHTFTGVSPDGANPFNSPLLDVNGTLYGTTGNAGANGSGTVYQLNGAGTETVLYSFCSLANCTDGWYPQSNVLQDGQGNLYGVALYGGNTTSANCNNATAYGCGVVYKLDASGHETVLHAFTGGTDGNIPQGLNMDSAGNLYGITFIGGDLNCPIPNPYALPGCGVVYKMDTSGNETVLYTFTGAPDGSFPNCYLTFDSAGNIYGVTVFGGNPADCTQYGQTGCGTVFKLDQTGKLTTLHTFTGLADGWLANGPMVLDAESNLYGATSYGGSLTCMPPNGCGVVFKITTAGTYSVLHTFTGPDGAFPPMGLTGDGNGNLYGVTSWGGNSADCSWSAAFPPPIPASGCGVVFKMDTSGNETVLYTFTGLADGAAPGSAPIMDEQGNLYGNTEFGADYSCTTGYRGNHGCGTVYKLELD